MSSKFDVYDISNYFQMEDGNIINFYNNEFIKKLKSINYSASTLNSNQLLDQLSHKHYGTELLWWIIALYNDIIDPINYGSIEVKIPDLSAVENLLLEVATKRVQK